MSDRLPVRNLIDRQRIAAIEVIDRQIARNFYGIDTCSAAEIKALFDRRMKLIDLTLQRLWLTPEEQAIQEQQVADGERAV